MPSFRIALSSTELAGARFVLAVRRSLQRALAEENKKTGITQSDIARVLGVHRSVINRELRGEKDITLSRVAELARALDRRAILELVPIKRVQGGGTFSFIAPPVDPAKKISRASSSGMTAELEPA